MKKDPDSLIQYGINLGIHKHHCIVLIDTLNRRLLDGRDKVPEDSPLFVVQGAIRWLEELVQEAKGISTIPGDELKSVREYTKEKLPIEFYKNLYPNTD